MKNLKQIFTSGSDQIDQGYTIESWHVSQSVAALTGQEAYEITVSGSLIVTGSTAFDGVVENGSRVWYETGGSLSVIPLGTFVRTTTSADTFVVVDNYGTILQYNC